MKKVNSLIILYFLMIALLISCGKKDNNKKENTKSREYITESGFKEETTTETTAIKETTTETYEIKKHPEDWSMTDKETHLYILKDVLDNLYGYRYFDKLPLSNEFRQKSNNGIFDYIEPLNRPDDWEKYFTAKASDEEFMQHLVWVYTESWTMERETLLQYTLDSENRLDSIKVIKTEITKDTVAEGIANQVKQFDTLERYIEKIPQLVISPVVENWEWENDGSGIYNCNGYTENFLKKYDGDIGIIDSTNITDVNEYDALTDIENKCVGVNVEYYSDGNDNAYSKNYKVYFEVDDRNFLDAITKVEEVLEDGTVVEVENNFGK